jgi:ABC-type nitrate/sulfonate/bicarbonate transport system substrate-binding protein
MWINPFKDSTLSIIENDVRGILHNEGTLHQVYDGYRVYLNKVISFIVTRKFDERNPKHIQCVVEAIESAGYLVVE